MSNGLGPIRILVVGDVSIDVIVVPRVRRRAEATESPYGWNYEDDHVSFRRAGGAWLLKDIIESMSNFINEARLEHDIVSYSPALKEWFEARLEPPCLRSISLLKRCPFTVDLMV